MTDKGIWIRDLEGNFDDMAALQRVIEGAPTYAERVNGAPPGPADAQSTYSILPPGKNYEDKFLWGVFDTEVMVGFADVIRGYRSPDAAHLAVLLVSEDRQNQGIGRCALTLIEARCRMWDEIRRIEICVAESTNSIGFFERHGFVRTGEAVSLKNRRVDTNRLFLEKQLG